MELKEALKRFRESKGLSQSAMAKELGLQAPQYQRYEWGQNSPSAEFIIKMVQTFGVSADYLLGLSDEPRPKKYDDAEVAEAFALRNVFAAMVKRAIVDVSKPKAAESVPNAETLTAISEVERGEGLSREFTSVDDLMKDLMSNA